jgi:hypothetical protein
MWSASLARLEGRPVALTGAGGTSLGRLARTFA